MTVTLDLRPEVEAAVTARAASQGKPVADFLQNLIEQMVVVPAQENLSMEEWEATLDALEAESEGLPVLSHEATTRAGIYGDHDPPLTRHGDI